MAGERTMDRGKDTRDSTARAEQMYVPASVLPFPAPEPGYVFRYVATHVMGSADPANVSKRFREGWVPCKGADYPELMVGTNADGNIEVGGLILCKMPEAKARARDAYYAKQTADQIESVDNNYMRNSDARMPLFKDRQTSVTRGRAFGNGNTDK